jgi:hypothetical protein
LCVKGSKGLRSVPGLCRGHIWLRSKDTEWRCLRPGRDGTTLLHRNAKISSRVTVRRLRFNSHATSSLVREYCPVCFPNSIPVCTRSMHSENHSPGTCDSKNNN